MSEPNPYGFGYQENVEAPPGQQPAGQVNPSQYRFSPEEMQVLGDCNRESFFQRSMPFGTLLGAGTFIAIQKGHLKPNPRFGVIPKVTLAVMAGYFIGKLSYQQACAEKLMALPGSYIGQLLRERRDGKIGGKSPMTQRQGPTMFGAKPSDIYSDAGPGSSLDLDTDRPLFSEDMYRPSTDSSNPVPESAPAPALSYDDLRRKNRGDYANTKQEPYRTYSEPVMTQPRPAATPSPQAPQTNKYGDIMD